MQFVFFYYLIKRMFRAVKVFFLLIRRRDLVKQLPGGYLRDLATSNRWVQMQLVGVLCFVIYPLTFISTAGFLGPLRAIVMVIGLVAMTMNIARLLARRNAA